MTQSPPRRSKRREIIEQLLEHLPDYEPALGTNTGGDGDGLQRMPKVYWDPSVQELYRTLDRLQQVPELDLPGRGPVRGSSVHAHLTSFYHCEHRTVRPRPTKRVVRGKTTWVEAKPATWRRERVVSPWIILPLVERGIAYIVDAGGFRGEPYLPKVILTGSAA